MGWTLHNRWKTIRYIIKMNVWRHPSFKRIVFTFTLVGLWLFVRSFTLFFRAIDSAVYYRHKRIQVVGPVFIISNPRSGTTLLQRLLATDQRIATFRLYHTLISAVSFYRLIRAVFNGKGWLGRTLAPSFQRLNRWFFGDWKGIHTTSLSQPEEDEGFWFLTGLSPAWAMATPYCAGLRELNILDNWPESELKLAKQAYLDFVRRFVYVNPDKLLLIKSVMSAGRVRMIQELFPEARFIFLDRDPLKTVPSYISMFSVPWKWHSDVVDQDLYREMGNAPIDFFTNLNAFRKDLPADRFRAFNFKTFVTNPMLAISEIYEWLDMEMTDEAKKTFEAAIKERSNYKSGHSYDLEDYGFSRKGLLNQLGLPDET